MTNISEISGNELYCLTQQQYQPGTWVMGNAVKSLGLSDKLESTLRGVVGLEVESITKMLREGRQNAYSRMRDAVPAGAAGVINVKNKLLFHANNLEFLATGSVMNSEQPSAKPFSFGNDGKQLYALLDAGYTPLSFVFGNVAYSTSLSGGLIGKLRSYRRGEVKTLSDLFNRTRRLALERMTHRAAEVHASAVLDIHPVTLAFTGVNEMIMTGSAVQHPLVTAVNGLVSSTLSMDETWSLAKTGYAPRAVLLGSSVFSLGFMGNISAVIQSLYQNEMPELTQLFAKARESALAIIDSEAKAMQAEDVIGVKMQLFQLGNGLIEFLAIGTAIAKVPGLNTRSESLPLPLYSRV